MTSPPRRCARPEQEATAAVAPDAGAEEAAPVRDALDEELDDVLRSPRSPTTCCARPRSPTAAYSPMR